MSKASDNVFPRFLISEGGSTTTPAAGRVTMYAKADGLLYSKDDAGAETLVSGGTGGTYTAQLSYVEFTAAVSVTGTTEAGSNNVVTSAAVTYDGSTPVMIDFFAPNVNAPNAASGFIVLLLYEDATILGLLGILRQPGTTSANMTAAMYLSRRITPASGSKAYSIKAYVSSGTGTITAGAGGTGTYLPGFIRISKAA